MEPKEFDDGLRKISERPALDENATAKMTPEESRKWGRDTMRVVSYADIVDYAKKHEIPFEIKYPFAYARGLAVSKRQKSTITPRKLQLAFFAWARRNGYKITRETLELPNTITMLDGGGRLLAAVTKLYGTQNKETVERVLKRRIIVNKT